MRKATHILLGAAAAMPVAVLLPPLGAVGAVWLGMVGGGWPDWFDLRSDFRRSLRLRHRGASHGVAFGMASAVFVFIVVSWMVGQASISVDDRFPLPTAWAIAFAVGFASHLVSDACTRAGIQPWLPFSRRRVWLLPRLFRGKSGGVVDLLFGSAALLVMIGAVGWLVLSKG